MLCVEDKSQIQTLDRTQPGLPMKPSRCGTMTHDYKRHGTTTLFAALSMLDGKVIGDCMPQHRHQEFIRFLKRIDTEAPAEAELHLIVLRHSQTPAREILAETSSTRPFALHPNFQLLAEPGRTLVS